MRILLTLLLSLSVAGCASSGSGETESAGASESGGESIAPAPEAVAPARRTKLQLARLVFEAIRARDFERFRDYLLREDEIRALYPQLEDRQVSEVHGRILELNRRFFAAAYATGERRGVVWQDAVFLGAQENGSELRPNIFILFSSGGESFSMKMDDCVETERGWLVGDYVDSPQHGESHRTPVDD